MVTKAVELLWEGDIFHGLVQPFIGVMDYWFYVFFMLISCTMLYMKTQTMIAPSILLMIFGEIYLAFFPPEARMIAHLTIVMGFAGLLWTILHK